MGIHIRQQKDSKVQYCTVYQLSLSEMKWTNALEVLIHKGKIEH